MNTSMILRRHGEIWLQISSEGDVEKFDEELMNKYAEDGCAYAKAFKAFTRYIRPGGE